MKAIQISMIAVAVLLVACTAGMIVLLTREPVQVVENPDKQPPVVVHNQDNAPVIDNTVTVSATGKVTLRPDVAYVTVGVETRDSQVEAAQSRNADIMNAIFDAVQSFGLKEEDMTTVNYSIYPVYENDKYDKPAAYTVSNSVQLRVKDLEDLGSILDAAAAAGANQSWGISFGVLDRESAYNEALAAAVENARIRAQSIAGAAGCTVGTLIRVSESGSYSYGGYDYRYAAQEDSSTPISTGEMEITATVEAVFQLNR